MSVVVFMLPHLKVMQKQFRLQVMANTQESDLLQQHGLDVSVEYAPVEREIHPWADLKALWWLYKRFRLEHPAAVHTLTPKAGLLGMVAARLASVPLRVHTFTGQVWVTRRGPMRWVLKVADKCIAALATDVLVDSPSQREFLIKEGVVSASRSSVLGAGSICGVDTQRFVPDLAVRKIVRAELGASDDALVCLYLGRLNRDKGVLDLAAAFAQVAINNPKAELWIVGPDENDWFGRMQNLLFAVSHRIKRVGYTNKPERFMQAADLFCLPSYREGFGSSVIEAAACGVPALASRIYGLTDAVIEGRTGWLHKAGDVEDLTVQLTSLLIDKTELINKGINARNNAINLFEQMKITAEMNNFYQKKLK